MKNRPIVELLKILLENIHLISAYSDIQKDGIWLYPTRGLCKLSENLFFVGIMTEEEYRTIWKYLDENLPTKQKNGYCWRMGSKAPRKKWLENQIKLLEETK
jgi:hypothetical protein